MGHSPAQLYHGHVGIYGCPWNCLPYIYWWRDCCQKHQDEFWSVSARVILYAHIQSNVSEPIGQHFRIWSILQTQPNTFLRLRSGMLCKGQVNHQTWIRLSMHLNALAEDKTECHCDTLGSSYLSIWAPTFWEIRIILQFFFFSNLMLYSIYNAYGVLLSGLLYPSNAVLSFPDECFFTHLLGCQCATKSLTRIPFKDWAQVARHHLCGEGAHSGARMCKDSWP